jgi:hypothetical protein
MLPDPDMHSRPAKFAKFEMVQFFVNHMNISVKNASVLLQSYYCQLSTWDVFFG